MSFVFNSLLLLFSFTALAYQNNNHRQHQAHSHGHAELSIAFDDLTGQIEFKTPSDDIVGFEHQAQSEKDKAKLNKAIAEFETQIGTYVQWEANLNCTMSKKTIDLVTDANHTNHADFRARFSVTCAKSVVGSTVLFDFTSLKKIKKIEATILVGELQLKSEIKSKKTSVKLTP